MVAVLQQKDKSEKNVCMCRNRNPERVIELIECYVFQICTIDQRDSSLLPKRIPQVNLPGGLWPLSTSESQQIQQNCYDQMVEIIHLVLLFPLVKTN